MGREDIVKILLDGRIQIESSVTTKKNKESVKNMNLIMISRGDNFSTPKELRVTYSLHMKQRERLKRGKVLGISDQEENRTVKVVLPFARR